jgi:hypothetical protein
MNTNTKYRLLLEQAYSDYSDDYKQDNSIGILLLIARADGNPTYKKPNIRMFEMLIISDKKFARDRNITIESRLMTWEEKIEWVMRNTDIELENLYIVEEANKPTTPTIISIITYNGSTEKQYK